VSRLRGTPYVFCIAFVASVGGFLFGWAMLPETKGRTLEEIAQSWKRGAARRGADSPSSPAGPADSL